MSPAYIRVRYTGTHVVVLQMLCKHNSWEVHPGPVVWGGVTDHLSFSEWASLLAGASLRLLLTLAPHVPRSWRDSDGTVCLDGEQSIHSSVASVGTGCDGWKAQATLTLFSIS